MSVSVPGNKMAAFAPPQRVLRQRYFEGAGLTSPRTYDVAADGRRFLMIKASSLPEDSATAVRMVVVLNWPTELTRLLSAR